jgi:hypothetical protein
MGIVGMAGRPSPIISNGHPRNIVRMAGRPSLQYRTAILSHHNRHWDDNSDGRTVIGMAESSMGWPVGHPYDKYNFFYRKYDSIFEFKLTKHCFISIGFLFLYFYSFHRWHFLKMQISIY